MKKLLSVFLTMVVASVNFGFAADGFSFDPTKKEIIIKTQRPPQKPHRDLSPDARAFLSEATVFVDLFEAGPTTVYVLDSRNRVIVSETSEGYEYESLTLPIPSAKGSYTLVVWGAYLYGEGAFTVE